MSDQTIVDELAGMNYNDFVRRKLQIIRQHEREAAKARLKDELKKNEVVETAAGE